MLSDTAMWREFGKGIIIYPFVPNNIFEEIHNDGTYQSNIDSVGIYVTASDVGWYFANNSKSRNAGKQLPVNEKPGNPPKKQFDIPPNEWVILCTDETIYLDNWFSGICHAKLSIALKGLAQIAVPLKPGSGSRLLLVFHNHTSENIIIDVGSQIALVTFHRLEAKSSIGNNFGTNRRKLMAKLRYDDTVFDVDDVSEECNYLCPRKKEEAAKLMKEQIKKHTRKHISFDFRVFLMVIIASVSVAAIVFSFLLPLSQHIIELIRYLGVTIFAGIVVAFFSNPVIFRKYEK